MSVYPNESEPVSPGTGLNIPAQVSLINLLPPSGIEPQFYIKQLQSKSHMEFVFYCPDIGIWVFNVHHFSTYDIGYDSGYSTLTSQVSFRTNSQRKECQCSSPIPTTSSASRERPTISPRTSHRSMRIAQSYAMAKTPSTESSVTTTSNESSVDTEMGGLDDLSRLSKAKCIFKKLAKLYLDKRQSPAENEVKELWEFSDLLDLRTVLKWRDEAGIKHGILFENGKIEFDKWPIPPHEDLIDIFENIFKPQFVYPWITEDDCQPNFDGKHNQGKKLSFFMNFLLILLHRYKFSREEETTQQLFHTDISSQSQYSSFRSREITAYPWITLANPHSRSQKLRRNLETH